MHSSHFHEVKMNCIQFEWIEVQVHVGASDLAQQRATLRVCAADRRCCLLEGAQHEHEARLGEWTGTHERATRVVVGSKSKH